MQFSHTVSQFRPESSVSSLDLSTRKRELEYLNIYIYIMRVRIIITLLVITHTIAHDPEDAVYCEAPMNAKGEWTQPVCRPVVGSRPRRGVCRPVVGSRPRRGQEDRDRSRRRTTTIPSSGTSPYFRDITLSNNVPSKNAKLSFPRSVSIPSGDDRYHIRVAPELSFVEDIVSPSYQTIIRSNTTINEETFGKLYNMYGTPVFEISAAASTSSGSEHTSQGSFEKTDVQAVSNYADFSSLISTSFGEIYMITHFESPLPSEQYIVRLDLNETSCVLTPIEMGRIDWSEFGGLWTPCAGSVSPWGTHMGSEEYEPDAKNLVLYNTFEAFWGNNSWAAAQVGEFMRYYDIYGENVTMDNIRSRFNPYRYGYILEIQLDNGLSTRGTKHYAMGRRSNELAYVMPDRRTVYMTDDGTNTMMTRFVADVKDDLTSGQLYIARLDQITSQNGGEFEITWIDLGHTSDSEIKQHIESGITFSDIFEFKNLNSNSECPQGFTSINQNSFGPECLRLRAGMETIASRLETRRYGAMLGGTTEFSKMEGFTFDEKRSRAYISLSSIRYGMEDYKIKDQDDASHDLGGQNHLRLQYNKCGCVFSLMMDDSYVATNLNALICGNTQYGTSEDECDPNGISNPDNIAMAAENTLIVGEDTSHHVNNAMWAFDLETHSLSRILTSMYGAECTGAYFYENLLQDSECSFMMAVLQHPYGENHYDSFSEDAASEGINAYVGTIGPLKRRLSSSSSSSTGRVVVIVMIVVLVAAVTGIVVMFRSRFSKPSSSSSEHIRIVSMSYKNVVNLDEGIELAS